MTPETLQTKYCTQRRERGQEGGWWRESILSRIRGYTQFGQTSQLGCSSPGLGYAVLATLWWPNLGRVQGCHVAGAHLQGDM
jgi:hypothetical protein